MELDKFFQSKLFRGLILGILILILVLLVLKIGMFIGAKRANFSRQWVDNYHRNFGGPKQGFMQGFGDRDFIESNGVFGQIIKIDSTTIVVRGRDNIEKIILIDNQTIIKRLQDTISSADLKIDDYIVVIGEPNDAGQIEAKFIRIMPPPPTGMLMPMDNN